MIRWSPKPRELYAVEAEPGIQAGLGLHSVFEHPGIWNLFWLSSGIVDDILDWKHEPLMVPTWSMNIPYAVGTGEQYLGDKLIKVLAMDMPAPDFLKLLQNSDCSKLIFTRMLGGEAWFDIMEAKIEKYYRKYTEIVIPEGAGDNVVPFNKRIITVKKEAV